ncbi:hypothetical protein HY045_01580 [Candidatus Woesebacteria bacterium]|nr:hypothetical protein [Candidatus Woesebacteria bacterium]
MKKITLILFVIVLLTAPKVMAKESVNVGENEDMEFSLSGFVNQLFHKDDNNTESVHEQNDDEDGDQDENEIDDDKATSPTGSATSTPIASGSPTASPTGTPAATPSGSPVETPTPGPTGSGSPTDTPTTNPLTAESQTGVLNSILNLLNQILSRIEHLKE